MSDSYILLEVDHHVTSIVQGRLDKKLYREFKKALGYRPEDYIWRIKSAAANETNPQKRKIMENWDGYISNVCYDKARCRCFNKKRYTHFSSGLVSKAIAFFKKYDIGYKLVDIRKLSTKTDIFSTSDELESRDYQVEVVNDACEQQRGIIKAATGSGKTAMAAAIIAKLGVTPFIFYVTSKDLLLQAQSELNKFIIYNDLPLSVGIVGDGHRELGDVTVMTVQTAVRALGGKYKRFDDEDRKKDNTDIEDMKDEIKNLIFSAKGIIADEIQYWAAETCQIIADCSVSAHYRYGMSATPWRDKGDDILIDACFGRCIADISASFLIRKNHLMKPEINFIHMDNLKNAKHFSYDNIYEEAIVNNSLRNQYISQLAIDAFEDGRLPLVLVRKIAHGNLLQSLIPDSVFLNGKISTKKRKAHLDKMRDRDCGVTIATTIFDEGVDVKPLDTLVLAGSGKSPTRALQRIGRILRNYPGKNSATVIDFMDHSKYLSEHSEKRRKIYNTEDEFVIKDHNLQGVMS